RRRGVRAARGRRPRTRARGRALRRRPGHRWPAPARPTVGPARRKRGEPREAPALRAGLRHGGRDDHRGPSRRAAARRGDPPARAPGHRPRPPRLPSPRPSVRRRPPGRAAFPRPL
ncbi:MAG: Glucosyl-3-phosphoglycerate synthase, partial [uncultured Solirubrobacterales bacterium]